jgi:outer membrane protein OmpA-like peptidoglycan-associated protein
MKGLLAQRHDEQEESHWLSVSDLMAGLMMVFLFIAIALMRNAFIERDKIKQVAVAYQENQVAIYQALNVEFDKDLGKWDAHIDEESLTITFRAPDVLFEVNDKELKDKFKSLLDNFFPRYMSVLKTFHSSINEVRIEGHTSSIWNRSVSDDVAYFKNMELSQGRTRSVLEYVYDMPDIFEYQQWIKKNVAAVGLSSSKVILDESGKEDNALSRRVSFRVLTNADIQIRRILQD